MAGRGLTWGLALSLAVCLDSSLDLLRPPAQATPRAASQADIKPKPKPGHQADEAGVEIAFRPAPMLLNRIYLRQEVERWLTRNPDLKPVEIADKLHDLYLQSGYPGVKAEVIQVASGWQILLHEIPSAQTRIGSVHIDGGTPRERYIVALLLRRFEGQPLDRAALLADIDWLDNNYFLPLELHYQESGPNQVDLNLSLYSDSGIYPTGNLALNRQVGLAVTAGVIFDDPFDSGQIVRLMGKRNNIPFPGYDVPNVVQDWEYTLSWGTMVPFLEGVTLGVNHYNKVDYIYSNFNNHVGEMLWIRTLGADLYSGFPIWGDPVAKRYIRGVVNLSLVQDAFNVSGTQAGPAVDTPQSLTESGKDADLLLMPSVTLSYSDIDNYRLPTKGNFLQTRISGSLLDAQYVQATLTGNSYWSPYADDHQQWTFLLRSAAGTSFGATPPFYRGFLNTGAWLVRGQTEYSISEKHSLRFAEEMHYIYKPTAIEIDRTLDMIVQQNSMGLFDGWAIDFNLFLDEGASWRDSIVPRTAQLSVGGGINFITPGGSILGLDLATPIYPSPGGFSAILRISSPFSYTLYSDWGNTNGYFLR